MNLLNDDIMNADTFTIIFKYLHVRDRATCMVVCRTWYECGLRWNRWTIDEYKTCVRFNLIQFARNNNVHPSANNNYAIRIALLLSRKIIIKMLLDDIRLDLGDDRTIINAAAAHGDMEVFDFIYTKISQRPDILDLIKIADIKKHTHMRKCLIQRVFDGVYEFPHNMIYICDYEDGVVEMCERSTLTYNEKYRIAIHAATTGRIEIVKYIHSSNTLSAYDLNMTAAMAGVHNHIDIVRFLMSDIKVINNYKADFAAPVISKDNADIIEYLLSILTLSPDDISNMIEAAARCQSMKILKVLLNDTRCIAVNSDILKLLSAENSDEILKITAKMDLI